MHQPLCKRVHLVRVTYFIQNFCMLQDHLNMKRSILSEISVVLLSFNVLIQPLFMKLIQIYLKLELSGLCLIFFFFLLLCRHVSTALDTLKLRQVRFENQIRRTTLIVFLSLPSFGCLQLYFFRKHSLSKVFIVSYFFGFSEVPQILFLLFSHFILHSFAETKQITAAKANSRNVNNFDSPIIFRIEVCVNKGFYTKTVLSTIWC
jgi:hypothetical protein